MSDFAPPPNPALPFIAIDHGTVTASYTEGANGRVYHDHEIGTLRFYVDLIEPEGRTTLWSGEDYEQAMREAERCRIEWVIDEPVHDNVAGGW